MDYKELKEELRDIKRLYETLGQLYESIEEFGYVDIDIDIPYKKILRLDLLKFMMYLSASDGILHPSEVMMFNEITSMDLDPEGIIDFVDEFGVYTKEFESKVPLSMIIAVMEELNGIGGHEMSYPRLLYGLFELIGLKMVKIDDDITYTELRDLDIYLSMLKDYMNDRGF